MSKKWSYFLSYVLPWAAMLSIEKTGIALVTFILQLSVIGWLPAALWAHAEMKKYLESLPRSTPENKPHDNSQETVKSSQSAASKKTSIAKKPKTSTTKKTSTSSKSKTKPKAAT